MIKSFINNNKLAMLEELRYMLFEVLDHTNPTAWDELSRLCKERTLNFAFAFENTITFLELIGIIQVNSDKSVVRKTEDSFDNLRSDYEFNSFMIKRIFVYLEANNWLQRIVNQNTLSVNASDGSISIHTDRIEPGYAFIKAFLLNLQITEPVKHEREPLVIAQPYKQLFREKLQQVIPAIESQLSKETKTEITENVAASLPKKKPTFFISYASEDKPYLINLQKHFSGLERTGIIESWDGRAILPGQDWDDEVRKKLEQAEVVLFLVSSDFMASDYINNVEIKKAMERHNNKLAKIIPIIVRHCDYQNTPIGRYQALPENARPVSKWKDQDEAYLNIVEQIKKIIM